MDRFRPRLGLLIVAATLVAAVTAPGPRRPPDDFPVVAARWMQPPDYVAALTTRPRECARLPRTSRDRRRFEAGRAAFRAPLLLGGQAARAGLACESCHSNGHRNADFHFPGLSDEPGTADVTASLMSSHRGNDRFDPRPIPDLAVPGRVSRAPETQALERFIDGLIVEEFDGPPPPPAILEALAFYVRSLGRGGCPGATEPLRVGDDLDDADRAIAAAGIAWAGGDVAAARLLLSATRSTLGRIDQRFAPVALAASRQALRNADLELLAIARAIDRNDRDVNVRIAAWRAGRPALAKRLQADAAASYYDPAVLDRALIAAVARKDR